jgi:ferredoxin
MPAKVRIAGKDVSFDAPEGEDILEILQRNAYPVATSCGGNASCGLCRLTVVSGKEFLSPIKAEEIIHLGNVAKVISLRLACQSQVCGTGEIVLDVPDVGDAEERKRKKTERLRGSPRTRGAPALRSYEVIEWRPGRKGST